MTPRLIDREGEIAELRALADAGGQKLALLYGRRRIGKTFLLTHIWPTSRAFYFTASATSPEINRRVLIEEASRWSGEALRPEDHPTWRTVFRSLLNLRSERDIIIILDEFQYLATDDAGLQEVASELNAVWEDRNHTRASILLVLSGFAIRTMEALSAGGAPLYGRLDWMRRLSAFDYLDAGRMVETYSPWDRLRVYAAFGGVPKYLASINDKQPLAQNIVNLLVRPDGDVRLQLETVLRQEEGLREFTRYQGILEAIGIKRRKVGEIAAALGEDMDSSFRRMISQLVEMGLLESERDFEEPRNRAIRYRIADPALRFYYGLIMPNESAIASSGADAVWSERMAERTFPAYVGREVFEKVVGQAYRRYHDEHGLPAVESWGRWSGQDRNRRSVEVDVVARLLDGGMLTGSAKARRRRADATVFLEHVDGLERVAASGRGWAREALEPDAQMLFVSASGFKESFFEAADTSGHPLIMWTLEDLYDVV